MPVRRAAQNGDTNKSPVVKTDPDDMEVEGKRGAKASAAMPPSSRAENGKSASPPKAAGSKSAVKTNAASTGTKTSPPAKASKGATKAGAPGSDYGARAIVVAMVGGFLLAACIYLYGQGGMSALSGIAKYSLSSGRKDVGKSKTMIERSKKLKALLKDEFPDDSQKEAVKIVRQVLLRNDRKRDAKTLQRAVVFLFGGGARHSYKFMERVITKHVLGSMYTDDSKPKGVLDLQYYDIDEGLRGKVVEHLEKSPRAVIILRDVDRLDKPDHLYALEDAFESGEIQHNGRAVDCRRAVFVLSTDLNHGGEVSARALREAAARHWTRQAFVARVREAVPFEAEESGEGDMDEGMDGMDFMQGAMGSMDYD